MNSFYQSQDEIKVKLNRLIQQSKDYNQENFKEIENELKQVEIDLAELENSIKTVEFEPSKFSQITTYELRARREFTEEAKDEIKRLRNLVTTYQESPKPYSQPRSIAQTNEIARNKQYHPFTNINNEPPTSYSPTSYFQLQYDQQQLLIAQQDRSIDELASTTDRLTATAVVLNTELIDQERMLAELDEDIDRETEHMNAVMRRMARVFKTTNRRQLCTILWLFLVFLFLLILVIS